MDMKIPKIIHYCWLGNAEKPSDVENYIQKWRSILKDYKIMEWNEESFPFSEIECIYLQDAM